MAESSARAWPTALTSTIVLAAVARIIALGHWPGINADEAWYGVNAQEFLAGRAAFLHTGVGNPLNPLHSVPLLALLRVMDPSPALLRVPEVMWGLLTVVLAYPLLAKPLGRRAAHFVVMLLAVCPAAVAYSRFGWDPSGTPFISLLATGLALGNWPATALLCLLVALVIHPTNVFLAPIVVLAWGPHAARRYEAMPPSARRRLRLAAAATVIAALPAAWLVLQGIADNPQTSLPPVAVVIARAFSLRAWFDSALGVAALFSGLSTAAFISGPLPFPATVVATLIASLAIAPPIAIGWTAFRSRPHAAWLLTGVCASLAAFHAVAGPGAMQPGRERYLLFVLVPLVILCALGLDALAETRPKATTVVFSLTYACFVAILCGGYFYPLAASGGESEAAFRTGPVEPKLAAYHAIHDDSANADVVSVVAEDWWLYWPLRYFAGGDPRIYVELMQGAAAPGGLYPAGSPGRPYPHPPNKNYAVVFDGSEAWAVLRSSNRTVFTAFDPLQRPILHVVALPSTPE